MRKESTPSGVSAPAKSLAKVLLIDDDPGVGRLYTRLLKRAGYVVRWVHSPEKFAESFRAVHPELIVVDVILGQHDCCTVLDFLGAQRSAVPVVLMSGYDHRLLAQAERTAKGNGLYIAGVIEKRHDPERLIEIIRRHSVTRAMSAPADREGAVNA